MVVTDEQKHWVCCFCLLCWLPIAGQVFPSFSSLAASGCRYPKGDRQALAKPFCR